MKPVKAPAGRKDWKNGPVSCGCAGIHIPAGAKDGQKIRIAGKGRPGSNGEAVMDLSAKEKQELKVEDILEKFNAISIECGN